MTINHCTLKPSEIIFREELSNFNTRKLKLSYVKNKSQIDLSADKRMDRLALPFGYGYDGRFLFFFIICLRKLVCHVLAALFAAHVLEHVLSFSVGLIVGETSDIFVIFVDPFATSLSFAVFPRSDVL